MAALASPESPARGSGRPRPARARRLARGLSPHLARVLVYFLGVNAVVLSVDALMAYALGPPPGTAVESFGAVKAVIPAQTILPRQLMAFLWAVELDGFGVAGLLGIRRDPGDWRAWIMALVAFAASFAFQVLHAPPILGRGVAPIAWAGAALVLEVPRKRRAASPGAAGAPQGTGSGTGGASGDGPGPVPGGAPEDVPEDAAKEARRAELAARLTDDQRAAARRAWDAGLRRDALLQAMRDEGQGAGKDKVYAFLATLEPVGAATSNGGANTGGGGGAPDPDA